MARHVLTSDDMAIAASIGAMRHALEQQEPIDRATGFSLADHIAKAAADWALLREDLTESPRPIHGYERGGPAATLQRRVLDDGRAVYVVAIAED